MTDPDGEKAYERYLKDHPNAPMFKQSFLDGYAEALKDVLQMQKSILTNSHGKNMISTQSGVQETIKYSDKIYDARVTRRLTLREVTKDLNLRGLKITAIELSEIETDRANPTKEQKKAINEYYQFDEKKL